jgi:hypothetical protein
MIVGLFGVAFVIAGLAIAQDPPKGDDDPPVRLKKRNRPEAAEKAPQDQPKPAEPPKDKERLKPKDPKEGEPKEGDESPPADDGQMDESEVLNRVGKNMRTSEDRLDHAELNDGTHQVQEDIVKDLDSLINRMQNGGGDDQDQNDQQDQQGQQQNQQNKQQGAKQKQNGQTKIGMGKPQRGLKGQRQARAGQGKKPGQKKQGDQSQQQANAGQQQGGQNQQQAQQQQPNNQGGGGGKSQGEAAKLAEMYKDVWGHLPETMRAEMNAYSREQFMAKYNELIKQYYSTVAEKSRKKD